MFGTLVSFKGTIEWICYDISHLIYTALAAFPTLPHFPSDPRKVPVYFLSSPFLNSHNKENSNSFLAVFVLF